MGCLQVHVHALPAQQSTQLVVVIVIPLRWLSMLLLERAHAPLDSMPLTAHAMIAVQVIV